MELNGKAIDKSSLVVEGVDMSDYPDFCDAFLGAGQYADGTELSDEELDELRDRFSDEVYELVLESIY